MKTLFLSFATAVAFFLTTAVAQSTPQDQQGSSTGSQGTTSSSPAMQEGTPSGTQGSISQGTGNQGSMQGNQGSMSSDKGMKGEKKLKGCIQSEGGQTVLKEKNGKTIPLTGQDLSAHVGHMVAVHGAWASTGMSSTDTSSSGGKAFNVTSVDMISDTCSNKESKGGK